ncbi:MAG: polyprenyl synthetase family protein [Bacteroidales bacterium]|jgi:geranylgeranyl diphosphate synthase, type II|nr:polyprenyl synthetase family protein [Bacteroidales bacterium]MDD2204541.1 polyprenyl synthetase family protein [Bacteroidales bacterium]MDD3152659.1 polyprenyl synthetase family protein [Bacteroidales bacterium]MDD3913482.1 polyprenyl synthetase family protein [Bacteroidales bacterium]MDD4633971.1 polyprenyl synthetase family protein [Bacteroidales bacterium]
MKTFDEISTILNDKITDLCDETSEIAKSVKSKTLYDTIKYALQQGGKRMRPLLLLLSSDVNGGNLEDAIYPALGLEIFHNFTLVHDDIMDKANIRRNHPTVYKKWNQNIAILTGDTMFATAVNFVTKTRDDLIKPILTEFCKTAIEVCDGQQFDMDFESTDEVCIHDYIEMIRLKTAVVIASALKIGSFIGNADEITQNALYKYGEAMGIAFQLMDDFLDIYGDSKVFGKNTGGDITCCKKTFPYLTAIKNACNKDEKDNLIQLYNNTTIDNSEKITIVTSLFNKYNVKQTTLNAVKQYQKEANKWLDIAHLSAEAKEALSDYSNKLFYRTY